jgi:YVTN family beta-propeller protein
MHLAEGASMRRPALNPLTMSGPIISAPALGAGGDGESSARPRQARMPGRHAGALLLVFALITSTLAGAALTRPALVRAASAAPPAWISDAPDIFSLTSIDTGSNSLGPTVGSLVEEGSNKAAVSPDGRYLYLPQLLDGAVMVVSTESRLPVAVVTGLDCPDSVALTPDGSRIYVGTGCTDTDTVHIIDTATDTLSATSFTAGKGPGPISIAPDGATGYVSNDASATVSEFDTTSNTVLRSISVGNEPAGSAITPDGAKLYVANFQDNTVSVIATAFHSVTKTIPVGSQPIAVGITPDGNWAYVVNRDILDPAGTVSIIDTATDSVAKTLTVGNTPVSVGITPDGAQPYVANFGDGTVSVLDISNQTVAKTLTVGGFPNGAVVVPDEAPVAAISVTPGLVGSPTAFDASASTVQYGSIVSYAWDFGDFLLPVVTAGPTTTHVYGHSGPFTASVTETDSAGTSLTQLFTARR